MKYERCILDESKICDDCGECDKCDLDPNKICDNCGKCLKEYKTDEKGYVKIDIDKIISSPDSLDDFYEMAGLADDEEEHDHCHCCDDDCDHDHTNHNEG